MCYIVDFGMGRAMLDFMKKLPSQLLLAGALAMVMMTCASANPSILPLGGPDAIMQSPNASDLAVSQNVKKAIANDRNLANTSGHIAVITTTDHMVYLRGTVPVGTDRQRILSVIRPYVASYRVSDQLVSVAR
jgi:osmotically-inducible protein OsmY